MDTFMQYFDGTMLVVALVLMFDWLTFFAKRAPARINVLGSPLGLIITIAISAYCAGKFLVPLL